ncbi:MAG: hypothetical protein FGM32_06310 [Candidatus Kapabacteria bacterium]|nr:hypothetical protein [Candidatus Kapabacteria bacterium]
MIVESVISVPNRHGDVLNTTLTYPANSDLAAPLMIILHGHKGFRNYGFLPWIAQGAAEGGMIALRMCFSLNGMDNTAWTVQKPEDFARNTLTREVDDVHDVLSSIQHDDAFANLRDRWNGNLVIVGHSRGGGIALVAGGEISRKDATMSDRLRVVGLNSVGNWTRWTPRQAQVWKRAGFVDIVNQRTGQTVRIDASFVEDLEQNAERLSLETAVERLDKRLLFIHAAQDLTVPLNEIQQLSQRAPSGQQLRIVENTTHTFGMTHPVERITAGFYETFTAMMDWIRS